MGKNNKFRNMVKINKLLLIILICAITFLFAVVFFLIKNKSANRVERSFYCNQLYTIKKTKYWKDEIGQSGAIYSAKLDTCLALNIHNNFDTKIYFAEIKDLLSDATLMEYSSYPKGFYWEGDKKITCKDNYIYFEFVKNGKIIKEYGCDFDDRGNVAAGLFDKMFEKVRKFGFKVFDGYSFE